MNGTKTTTIRTALMSSAVAALIWWADHSGSAKATRYIAFQISSNNNIGNICTGYRSPNAAVAPRPASKATWTPRVAANSFVWWITAGQIYRRNSESSGMAERSLIPLAGTGNPTPEFMVMHPRLLFLDDGFLLVYVQK